MEYSGNIPLLCLITGPSGSGKTSIALELQSRLLAGDGILPPIESEATKAAASVVVLHQDHYFTKPFVPYQERTDDSYEDGSGIDWDRLVADIESSMMATQTQTPGVRTTIIVEGHILGNAAALLRQRFLGNTRNNNRVGVLVVLLSGCAPGTCKQRRLRRRTDRSDDDTKQLEAYIDDRVWPCYRKHGVAAMEALKRELLGSHDSHSHSERTTMLLELDNSEPASVEASAGAIAAKLRELILARTGSEAGTTSPGHR